MDINRYTTEELLSLAEAKRESLNQALRLTQAMLEVLAGETPEYIEVLLDERQHCFDKVEEINRSYDLLYINVREQLSPEGFALVRSIEQAALEIGRSIQVVDKEVSEGMHALLSELRQKLVNVNTGKKGLAAYSQHEQPGEGVLVDEKK
ncbi:MAG: hypothetical protein FD169_1182 [Bacillota bacterium]|nr:MAG: hypothetical protein FD169_1182 [Bacillota bacterium]